jgi:hypothetical protein
MLNFKELLSFTPQENVADRWYEPVSSQNARIICDIQNSLLKI